VASSGPFPYFKRLWPALRLRSSTNEATSPSIAVAFQVSSLGVPDATNFGMLFIRSMNSEGTPAGASSAILV
jgi:hypothetical protein